VSRDGSGVSRWYVSFTRVVFAARGYVAADALTSTEALLIPTRSTSLFRIFPLAALGLVIACGGEGEPSAPTPEAGETAATAPAAEPKVAATETTSGFINVTIGGEAMTFAHLPSGENYVLATNVGLNGTTDVDGGAELRVMGMFQTVSPDGPFPQVLDTEDMQLYMKRRQEDQAAGKASSLARSLQVLYTTSAGAKHIGTGMLTVSSYDGSKMVGTLTATLRLEGGGEPVQLTDGTFEVTVKSPIAGRAVEKLVTGR